ncbi:putative ensconsin-like [Cocos nucifera]|uniref:Putative ensconsin-like n=1 Tax=Cocos nucifera TaxID=13894 RepID=A0A8K0IMQ8_COCNU|nr:putative ensconsin-like [Cocos nucifera]
MPDGTSKRTRVDTPSSTAPVNTTAPIEAIAATEATVPLVSSSPPTEVQIPEPPTKQEKGVDKKKKSIARKVRCKVSSSRSNGDDEDLGENPFKNHEIVNSLIDGCNLPEVVDRITNVDFEQCT